MSRRKFEVKPAHIAALVNKVRDLNSFAPGDICAAIREYLHNENFSSVDRALLDVMMHEETPDIIRQSLGRYIGSEWVRMRVILREYARAQAGLDCCIADLNLKGDGS